MHSVQQTGRECGTGQPPSSCVYEHRSSLSTLSACKARHGAEIISTMSADWKQCGSDHKLSTLVMSWVVRWSEDIHILAGCHPFGSVDRQDGGPDVVVVVVVNS